MVDSIEIKNLYGYMNKKIEFKNLNFLVGINGSGKTSILRILLAFLQKEISYFENLIFDEIILIFNNNRYAIKKEKGQLLYTTNTKSEIFLCENGKKGTQQFKEKLLNCDEKLENLQKDIEEYDEKIEEKKNLFEKKKIELKTVENKLRELEKNKKNVSNEEILKKIEINLNKMNLIGQILKIHEELNDIILKKSEKNSEINSLKLEMQNLNLNLKKEEFEKSKMMLENMEKIFFDFEPKIFSIGIDEKYDLKRFEEMFEKLVNNKETSKLKEKMLYSLSPIEKISNILNDKIQSYLKEINKESKEENVNKTSDKTLKEIKEFEKLINLFLKEAYKKLTFDEKEAKFEIEILGREKQNICNLSTENLTILSSGEQQIFILVTTLFFSLNDNSIILIDEPEKSMHVEWQKNFMEVLKQIMKKFNNIQIILATHSIDMLEEEDRENFIPVFPYNTNGEEL